MKEFISSVSTKGQITLPPEVRLILGLKPKDKVAFFLKDEGVLLIKPAAVDLAAGFKSIPALKSARPSDEITEIAAEEHAEEAAREGSR